MLITVTNQKGGIGKTTLSTALMKYLSEGDPEAGIGPQKVIGVDFDEKSGLTYAMLSGNVNNGAGFVLPKFHTVYDAIMAVADGADPVACVDERLIDSQLLKNVQILPANKSLQGLVYELTESLDGGENSLAQTLRFMLEPLLGEYIVIIDTGTNIKLIETAIAAADVVIIPITFDPQASSPIVSTISYAIKTNRPTIVFPWNVKGQQWEMMNYNNIKKGMDGILNKYNIKTPLRYTNIMMGNSYRWRNNLGWLSVPFPPNVLEPIRDLVRMVNEMISDVYGQEAE